MQPHKDRMLLDTATVAVIPQKHGVNVTFLREGKLQTVEAKGVIMATPKFITARIVEGLPQKQKDAIARMHYIPYAVVNLVYDKPVFNRGYDTWCPGNSFTDFVVADWTVRNQPGYKQKYNILTCYTPLQPEQRGILLTQGGSRQLAASVLRDFKKLLPETNVDPVEVQIYRRGHPLYQSLPGNYTQVLPQVRKSMDRVFFANTDSEGPVSTTPQGIQAARRAVKEYQRMVAGRRVAAHTQRVIRGVECRVSCPEWNRIAVSMASAERTIFHVDMDAFFVSVEELFDPTLKGKPVVVGGQAHERGVVSAASYAARKFGVHSAMPLRTAAKLCPQAVFVDGHPERYRDYSGKVFEVLNRFSPKLEMVSIDKAYVDMTGTERLHGPPIRAAHALP